MITLPRTAPTLAIAALLAPTAFAATGPSSSATPYLTPLDGGVSFTSLLTTGDYVRKTNKGNELYRMAGTPDGLGAFDNGDGTITVLAGHEFTPGEGVVRAHGGAGSFVSKWQVRKSDLKVLSGDDEIRTVNLWDGSRYVATPGVVFSRFCSADLPAVSALFNHVTGKGFSEGRVFLDGEEVSGGRAFAHIVSGRQHGTSYQLPRITGNSYENLLASPYEQDKTVVIADNDGSLNASKVYVYVGQKQTQGSPIDQAGLTNGATYQLAIDGYATESGASPIPNGFVGNFSLGASGGTGLNRVEDGAWDTSNPNRYYFVTTASFTTNTRLWRLTFNDIKNPQAGGKIEVLVDGDAWGAKMLDNMTVDSAGDVYLQEDVGNQPHLGKLWRYHAGSGVMTQLAQHDESRFISGAPADIDGTDSKQSDEESSGVVDVSALFDGVAGYDTAHYNYFLLDVQAHYTGISGVPLAPELFEGGQLLMMKVAK